MNITFILKGKLEKLPPMLPRLMSFAQKGFQVKLICAEMTAGEQEILNGCNIECHTTNHATKFLGKENRLKDWSGFYKGVKKVLSDKCKDTDLLYICSADTALCLGALLNNYEYVLQSNELYDTNPLYRKGLKKYMRKAKAVVVPEYCRANICMYWYNLQAMPFVIPNTPFLPPCQGEREIQDKTAKNVIESIKNRKIIIYQGHISCGDRDLRVVAEALKQLNDSRFVLLLMGRVCDDSVEQLKSIYNDTYYIPFVKAPGHLDVTSHAYMGLLSYDRVCLNNIFCAPNKIYEYSSLGIPMLGNNIPGLKYVVEHHGIGKCADYENVNSVVNAIKMIDRDHQRYVDNMYAFGEKNNINDLLNELVDRIKG